jgi:dihydropteroate synthase
MRDTHPLSQQPNLSFLSQRGRIWIMGVLNATPDSFYAGSRTPSVEDALTKAGQMIEEGADLLDIGGESTRPGALPISGEDELARVLPIVKALQERWPEVPLSIDTQKADVARQAAAHGARVINDISAMRNDPAMAETIAETGCSVVLMHMQGTPQTMQQKPRYDRLMEELKEFFKERIAVAVKAGIPEDKILIDPGIGFGKTLEHNMTILKNLSQLTSLGRPLLVGISRKSFIGKLLEGENVPPPEQRLAGTLAATLQAVQQGAQGVRVHDVGATRQALSVWQGLQA